MTTPTPTAPPNRGQPPDPDAPPVYQTPVKSVPVGRLSVHPLVASLPRMPPSQYSEFVDDVRQRGVQKPLVITRDDQVIAGRHRFEAGLQRGDTHLPCRRVDWDQEKVTDYVYHDALMRQHLTDDQRAMLAAQWREHRSRQARQQRARKAGRAGGRGRTKGGDDSLRDGASHKLSPAAAAGPPQPSSTRAEAAARLNVSD